MSKNYLSLESIKLFNFSKISILAYTYGTFSYHIL